MSVHASYCGGGVRQSYGGGLLIDRNKSEDWRKTIRGIDEIEPLAKILTQKILN